MVPGVTIWLFKEFQIFLKVTINVLMTMSESMTVVSPTDSDSVCNVNVGLIEKKHYVGLDVVSNVTSESSADEVNVFKCNDGEDLDDATIEMGDQQLMQITGGPQMCSMLSAENPETEGQVYSVAPAEGQRPINIMTDSNFELMCNPDKFPFGTGGFNQECARKITQEIFSAASGRC